LNKKGENCKKIGKAKTIGELKELIKNYPDNTLFGFRNQPIQELYECKYDEFNALLFQ
jgi:predicted translin family RNA/ssDNA-binding protein